MTKEESIECLYEIKQKFERSVFEAEIGDEYAIEAQDDNANAVRALDMAIAALQKNEWILQDDGEPSPEVTAARKAGQEEAWELARQITDVPMRGGFEAYFLVDAFGGTEIAPIFSNNTYSEALAKVEAQIKNGVFKIGDVVRTKSDPDDCGDMVVIDVEGMAKDCVTVVYGNFCKRTFASRQLIKTGRMLPVNDWMRRMRGRQ